MERRTLYIYAKFDFYVGDQNTLIFWLFNKIQNTIAFWLFK